MKSLSTRYIWTLVAMVGGLVLALGLIRQAGAQAPAAPPATPLAQACSGDNYEPDDVYTSARPIAVTGGAQTHTFHTPGDVDWVKFAMTAGRVYTITTSNLISLTDTVLDLYGTNGVTLLASNDNIGSGSGTLASQIVTTAAQSGTYYVRVWERNSHGGCIDYGYNVSITSYPVVIYLPIVAAPPTLAISGLEVTQSVQNPANSVPLVANRNTVLRVYPYSLTGQPISNVSVSVAASRDGTVLVIGPKVAPIVPTRADYTGGFSVKLPSGWLTGSVVITANAYIGSIPQGGVSASMTLNFTNVPTLDVMVVPITYTHAPDGWPYPAPPANVTTTNEIRDWIMRAYPVSDVSISFHNPITYAGNLLNSSDWYTLLSKVTGQKSGSPSVVYYGLIPTTDGIPNTSSWHRWFYSGYSGLGWVGGTRASIGLELPTSANWGVDQTGENAAHEIGHNLGRLHAPCGNVAGPDPSYPYAGGSIGQFGLDIPKGVLWNPATTFDLMSYCDPQWVSDYTYQGLYTDQLAHGTAVLAASAPGLFIRGDFPATGQVTLKPVYALSLPLTELPADSDYQVELLDATGQVVAAYPVQVLEASLDPGGGIVQSINTVVPQPAQPVAQVRLVHLGQVAAEKALTGAGVGIQSAPTVSRQPGGPMAVSWSAAAMPALVRYSADGGQTWTTLGVDVLGGQLTVDPAALPGGGAGQFEVTLAAP